MQTLVSHINKMMTFKGATIPTTPMIRHRITTNKVLMSTESSSMSKPPQVDHLAHQILLQHHTETFLLLVPLTQGGMEGTKAVKNLTINSMTLHISMHPQMVRMMGTAAQFIILMMAPMLKATTQPNILQTTKEHMMDTNMRPMTNTSAMARVHMPKTTDTTSMPTITRVHTLIQTTKDKRMTLIALQILQKKQVHLVGLAPLTLLRTPPQWVAELPVSTGIVRLRTRPKPAEHNRTPEMIEEWPVGEIRQQYPKTQQLNTMPTPAVLLRSTIEEGLSPRQLRYRTTNPSCLLAQTIHQEHRTRISIVNFLLHHHREGWRRRGKLLLILTHREYHPILDELHQTTNDPHLALAEEGLSLHRPRGVTPPTSRLKVVQPELVIMIHCMK